MQRQPTDNAFPFRSRSRARRYREFESNFETSGRHWTPSSRLRRPIEISFERDESTETPRTERTRSVESPILRAGTKITLAARSVEGRSRRSRPCIADFPRVLLASRFSVRAERVYDASIVSSRRDERIRAASSPVSSRSRNYSKRTRKVGRVEESRDAVDRSRERSTREEQRRKAGPCERSLLGTE